MSKYLIAAMAVLALGVGGFAVYQMTRANALASENATLTRNLQALEAARDQADQAREVAKAHAERWEKQAEEYAETLETLTDGVEDEDLDPALRDRLNRMLEPDGGVRSDDRSGGATSPGSGP